MKLIVGNIDFDLAASEFEMDAPSAFRVLGTQVVWATENVLLVRPGMPPRRRAIARLIIECDPDAPMRRRRFVAIPRGSGVESEEPLEFRALFTNEETNAAIALYELVEARPSVSFLQAIGRGIRPAHGDGSP